MKAFDKQSDPNLIKRSIDAGLSSVPGLSIAWALCKALYGNALELRQQKALEWVEMIKDNPAIFRKEILESTDFQDGFIVALEDYLKIRTILKRGMARKIFIHFAQAEDKEQFELERYDTTLSQISIDSLDFVAYIKELVEPRQQERITQTLDTIDFSISPIQLEQAKSLIAKQNPLSYAYKDIFTDSGNQIMLPNKPSPQYPGIQGSMGVTIQDTNRVKHGECLVELASLGLISRNQYTTPVSNTNSTTVYHDIWDYTDYGKKFVEFVERTN
jgi:hypothetical protein